MGTERERQEEERGEARALLGKALVFFGSHPEAWTQGAFARSGPERTFLTVRGVRHPQATCWCLEGYLSREAPTRRVYMVALDLFERANGKAASIYNDTIATSAGDVVEALERTLDAA